VLSRRQRCVVRLGFEPFDYVESASTESDIEADANSLLTKSLKPQASRKTQRHNERDSNQNLSTCQAGYSLLGEDRGTRHQEQGSEAYFEGAALGGQFGENTSGAGLDNTVAPLRWLASFF